MAWIWMPDNNGMNPYMFPGENPTNKDLRRITAWLDEQKAIAKKKNKPSKPRVYTTLEAWGLTVLFGPFVYMMWYYGIEALQKIGQQYIMNLNVPH